MFSFYEKRELINFSVSAKELTLFVTCDKGQYFDWLSFADDVGDHSLCLWYYLAIFILIDHNNPGSSSSSLSGELHRDEQINTIPVSNISFPGFSVS